MSKVAVIIADMFEDVEYTGPAEGFESAGHELVHIGLEKGSTVKGKKEGTPVMIDQEVVEDGNLISSRNPDDVPAFTQAALARL